MALTEIGTHSGLFEDDDGRIVCGVGDPIITHNTNGTANNTASFSVYGSLAASAGAAEHVLENDYGYENVLRLRNKNANGWGAIAFDKPGATGKEAMAVGVSNGYGNFGPSGTGYIEVSNFNNTPLYGTHRFIQTCAYSGHNALRYEVKENGDMVWYDRAVPPTPVLVLRADGSVQVGKGSLPTNATTGFVSMPSMSGCPTGAPTVAGGFAQSFWDSENKQWCVYDGEWYFQRFTPGSQTTPIAPPAWNGWIPGALGTNLKLWVDATFGAYSGSELAQGGEPISTLSDRSGNAFDLTASGTARPTLHTNIQHTLPSIRWDAASNCMTSGLLRSSIGASMWTASVVIPNSLSTNREYFGFRDASTSHQWLVGTTAGTKHRSSGYDGSEHAAATTDAFSSGDAVCLVNVFNGTSVSIYKNGVLQQSVSSGSPSIPSTTPFKIGGHFYPADCDLCELAVVVGVPSSEDIASASAYLMGKWGIV